MIKIITIILFVIFLLICCLAMIQENNTISRSALLFLFQPFGGFLASLKQIDNKSGRFIFIAFSTLWGYAQSFNYPSADCYRLGASFCQYPISSIGYILSAFAEGKAIDGYLLFSNYFVHLFSDNAKVYFAFLGFIYGIVCYETIVALVKERRNEKSNYLSHLLFLFFATSSFANLSMPRYWTASWIAAFVFLKITQGEKKWVFLSLIIPLIHFSFVPIVIGLFVISLFSRQLNSMPKVLFWLVAFMFLVSFVLPESIIAQLIPEDMINGSSKLTSKMGYVNGSSESMVLKEVSAYREANGIVTKLFQMLMKIGSFLLIYHLYSFRSLLKKDRQMWTSFISILFLAFLAYFMSVIPSTGWRYINVLWMCLYIVLYRYYDIFRPNKFRNCILSLYLINIYTICFMFYVTYRTVDLMLFYAPLPIEIFHGIGFPPVYFV